jgi:peroxiredoxin
VQRDVALVAISVDAMDNAQAMAQLVGAEFPILADPEGEAVRAYNIYNLLGDGVSAPATFLIGKDGTVLWSYVGNNAADRPPTPQVLQRIDSLVP